MTNERYYLEANPWADITEDYPGRTYQTQRWMSRGGGLPEYSEISAPVPFPSRSYSIPVPPATNGGHLTNEDALQEAFNLLQANRPVFPDLPERPPDYPIQQRPDSGMRAEAQERVRAALEAMNAKRSQDQKGGAWGRLAQGAALAQLLNPIDWAARNVGMPALHAVGEAISRPWVTGTLRAAESLEKGTGETGPGAFWRGLKEGLFLEDPKTGMDYLNHIQSQLDPDLRPYVAAGIEGLNPSILAAPLPKGSKIPELIASLGLGLLGGGGEVAGGLPLLAMMAKAQKNITAAGSSLGPKGLPLQEAMLKGLNREALVSPGPAPPTGYIPALTDTVRLTTDDAEWLAKLQTMADLRAKGLNPAAPPRDLAAFLSNDEAMNITPFPVGETEGPLSVALRAGLGRSSARVGTAKGRNTGKGLDLGVSDKPRHIPKFETTAAEMERTVPQRPAGAYFGEDTPINLEGPLAVLRPDVKPPTITGSPVVQEMVRGGEAVGGFNPDAITTEQLLAQAAEFSKSRNLTRDSRRELFQFFNDNTKKTEVAPDALVQKLRQLEEDFPTHIPNTPETEIPGVMLPRNSFPRSAWYVGQESKKPLADANIWITSLMNANRQRMLPPIADPTLVKFRNFMGWEPHVGAEKIAADKIASGAGFTAITDADQAREAQRIIQFVEENYKAKDIAPHELKWALAPLRRSLSEFYRSQVKNAAPSSSVLGEVFKELSDKTAKLLSDIADMAKLTMRRGDDSMARGALGPAYSTAKMRAQTITDQARTAKEALGTLPERVRPWMPQPGSDADQIVGALKKYGIPAGAIGGGVKGLNWLVETLLEERDAEYRKFDQAMRNKTASDGIP